MRAVLRWLLAAVIIVLAVPVAAQQGQKADKSKERPSPETKEDKDKPEPKANLKKGEAKKKPVAKERFEKVEEFSVARVVRLPGNESSTLQFEVPGLGNNWQRLERSLADDVKVRMLHLPVLYNERGKPRPYTAREKEELKGPDRRLPGYSASLEDLKPGQIVQLTTVRRAGYRPIRGVKEVPPEYQPVINLIVIVGEPSK